MQMKKFRHYLIILWQIYHDLQLFLSIIGHLANQSYIKIKKRK
ncbi:hypothetical protein RV15_GL003391 [Enterococcus silesiacus]|uniref:Uncharacterized protein n=1 Tax=Enterococcus silesiacus TaxID=332949 RepID=A0AA91GBV8_9ENTE|nr:hypothetical protein RV15_GL003391 [Enterococcus silesiacus]